MADNIARRNPADLDSVRDHQDYAVAELLGQYAQLDPTAELNQLAATLASRLYSRLGA
jgi:hypothetical protein